MAEVVKIPAGLRTCAFPGCREMPLFYCSGCPKGYCDKHRGQLNFQDGGQTCADCRD